jgi:predicted transcriptional regulator
MSLSATSYRDRIYIVEDIILKLADYGELTQTTLISFCGLNLHKHRCILDELEVNGLIQKGESSLRKRIFTVYKPTQKGLEFCRSILEPYEKVFPRRRDIVNNEEKPARQSSRQRRITITSTAKTTAHVANNNNNNTEQIVLR